MTKDAEKYDATCRFHKLRSALQRKCRERGYPFSDRLLEVAKFIAPAFAERSISTTANTVLGPIEIPRENYVG
jgi:hypothetical protein